MNHPCETSTQGTYEFSTEIPRQCSWMLDEESHRWNKVGNRKAQRDTFSPFMVAYSMCDSKYGPVWISLIENGRRGVWCCVELVIVWSIRNGKDGSSLDQSGDSNEIPKHQIKPQAQL